MRHMRRAAVVLATLAVAGCASLGALGQFVQAPRFAAASGQPATLRLVGPSSQHPLGGVAVRLWARVENPNSFGLTLASLAGNLYLQGQRAADVSFPLGLPLRAAADTVIPLDVAIGFADLPGLRDVATRALSGNPISYRLDGTAAIDAGPLGQPSFGPMTLLQGALEARR